MKRHLWYVLGLFLIVFCSVHVRANTSYTKIYTADDLYNVRDDLSGNYILMNDIDLTTVTSSGGRYDYNGNGWEPIGISSGYGSSKPFTGVFNGNGFKIKGMRIDIEDTPQSSEDYINVGLFGYCTGEIRNVNLVNVNVNTSKTQKGVYAGAIAGRLHGILKNCSVTGKVSINSISTNFLQGTYNYNRYVTYVYAGGLAGYAEEGSEISYCHNGASVTGVAGDNRTSVKRLSYYNYCHVGGIVSECLGPVSNSYNSGEISGSSTDITGPAGSFETVNMVYVVGIANNATITNCYNCGVIKTTAGTAGVGGISIWGTMTNCYNVGDLINPNGEVNPIGSKTSSKYENCYYKKGVGEEVEGTTGLTANQILEKTKYVGFDFTNVWYMDPSGDYKYPQLLKELDTVDIKSYPTKTEYLTDDDVDISGGVLTAYYIDGTNENIAVTSDMISVDPLNTPGEYDVKIQYRNYEFSYSVNVKQRPDIDKIILQTPPDKTEFVRDTEFDFSGAVARLCYVDGTYEDYDLTTENTSGGDISKSGNYTITFTKLGYSVSFEVKVIPVVETGIEISKLPDKCSYIEGESVSLDGIQVRAVYNNGTYKPIADYNVGDYENSPGSKEITITYGEFTASFQVIFEEKEMVSIAVKKNPNKLSYVIGQPFDITGMVVEATYNNGTVEEISDYSVGEIVQESGIQKIAVEYKGKSAYVEISVAEKMVSKLEVTNNPAKMEYIEGTTFNRSGMIVEALYNDETRETITEYVVGEMPSEIGTQPLEISYGGKTTTILIVIKEKSVTKIKVTKPEKTEYIKGERFDPSGMVITAYYDNGKDEEVTDYNVSGFGNCNGDDCAISVSYEGVSTSFNIIIHDIEHEWVVTNEASCTEDGHKVKKCKNCGMILLEEDVKAIGHEYGKWQYKDSEYHERVCEHDKSHVEFEGHNWGKTTIVKDATCKESGLKEKTCSVCGEKVVEDIPMIAHKPVTVPAVAPTCEEEGYTEGTKCSVCGEFLDGHELIPALGHDFSVKTVKPTCTEEGYSEYTCKNCDYFYRTDYVDALGHTEVIDPAVPATETTTGLTEGSHCSVCKKVLRKQEVIPALVTKVSSISVSGISHNIATGKRILLVAKVGPGNATNKKLNWTSSNPKVATVSQNGLVVVKPKTGGKTAVITAVATDGSGKKASWSIKSMKGIVKKVTIKGKKKVKAGKALKLKAKVKATKGANKKLKWTSSNPKWATVNGSGKVFTKAAGKGKSVQITAMATDGSGKRKTVTIKIK